MAHKPYVNLKFITLRESILEMKHRSPTPEMLKDAEALAHFLTYGERVDYKARPDLKPAKSAKGSR